MSIKSMKEHCPSWSLKRCSTSAPAAGAPLPSRHSFSSSLAAPDGEERKPPKRSLKNKIATMHLLDGGPPPKVRELVPPFSSRSLPSRPTCSELENIEQCEEENGVGTMRSVLDPEGAEKDGGRGDESLDEETEAPSRSLSVSLKKRTRSGPTLGGSSLHPADYSCRTKSLSSIPLSGEKGDEEEESTQIVPLADEEELGRDSEAGLFAQPEPEGPFEPLVLWPPNSVGGEEGTVQVPASINSRLLEHQREGVFFLYDLYRSNKGGVLGDDMGLGKTIQTIAFLAAILQKDSGSDESLTFGSKNPSARVGFQKKWFEKVVLIICPTSVVHNWEQEFRAWGEFEVGVCHGLQREAVMAKIRAKEVEIVLTSHDTFRNHGEEFCKVQWDCVVVDEAHRLKNDKSLLYTVSLKLPTKRRYGLTGTVMQNKYIELFNVFDWATPGCLGTREHFREYYSSAIAEGQRISAPQRFVRIAQDRKKHLAIVLQGYHLRRTKQETIGHMMKGKEDNIAFCAMSSVQKRAYKRVLQSPDYEALTKKHLPCPCGSPLTRGECCYRIIPNGVIWQSLHKECLDEGCDLCPNCLTFPCMNKLRLLSNHVELIKPNPKDDPEKQDRDRKFALMALGEDAAVVGGIQQEQDFLELSDTQHCGKMSVLQDLLLTWLRVGDKVLLFSDSVKMLDILEKLLIRKGYCHSRLDGSIPMNSRQALVDDFNRSPSKQIFLISTRAGGLGLNLTSANRVVIFDPNWNPAHDLQAQDRSFRFGQSRHVTVYRLIARGTLEELVYTRQIYKQQLFNIALAGAPEKRYFEGVQGSKQHKGELFGLSNLFRDISEDLFAEDIIENHEERLQQMAELEDTPAENLQHERTGAGFAEEEVDYEGDITCEEAEDYGSSPELATKEHDVEDTEEEQSTQRRVLNVLTNAGVVYSHRNEDVVNLAPPAFKAPKRALKQTQGLQNKSKKQQKEDTDRPTQRKERGKTPRQPQKKRSSRDSGVAKDIGSSSASPVKPKNKVIDEGKRALFHQLLASTGMGISEFSELYYLGGKRGKE